MSDIVKAIEVENKYLESRMNGQYPFHLVDKIKECGFESLEQFQKEKRIYRLRKQDFTYVESPMPGGVAEIFKMVASNKAGVLFVDWNNTYVVCGETGLKEYNKEYCEENNITVFPLYAKGGTIVGAKGDFSFGVCTLLNAEINSEIILDGVRKILQSHTNKIISVKGNDILADGEKICGSTTYQNEYVFMIIMHYSFENHSELISNICTTTKVGKPVSYVDFMTRDAFKQEVAKWLQVHST